MEGDRWSRWLLERRFGGDEEMARAGMAMLAGFRDRVLEGAALAPGETLLDVGCGDGLIGFGALEREPGCRVIFADISAPLLARCREIAADLDLLDRCEFVEADAAALAPIADGSVDVVTTRSVLIYVAGKAAAFEAMARVLRPGGRISLFEPINRFTVEKREGRFMGYDVGPVADLVERLRARYGWSDPDADPMTDFDERDLLDWARGAGFLPVRLDYRAELGPPKIETSWEGFLTIAPNPNAPTLDEAMTAVLTPAERDRLVAHLRPLVEAGDSMFPRALAYLRATRQGG